MKTYAHGSDVLGVSMSDFTPYLKMVGGIAGGFLGGGGDSKAAAAPAGGGDQMTQMMQMQMMQQQREASERARREEASAKQMHTILYVLGGVAGLVTVAMMLRRK